MELARARFLHTADLHLSRPFGFLPPRLAEERRRDQRGTLARIADLAIEQDVEVVLIAGDLFDSADPDPTDLEAVTREFSRLTEAGKRIFAIPGNHDPVSPNSFWPRLSLEGLHVFLEPEWSSVDLAHLGMSVSGIAFHPARSERRAFEGLSLSEDMPSIVLCHASYELFEGQIERYHPFSVDELSRTRATYIALGHYHKFNSIPADGVAACYPGTPEGISFDSSEVEDRFVVLGEIGEDGDVRIDPIKVNHRTMRSAEINCASFESQPSFLDAVRKLCEPNALIELRLTGSPNSDIAAVVEELTDRFRESCFHLDVNSSNLSLPVDLPTDDRTIRGRFCRHMLRQIEAATDSERRRLLQRALELGLAAFSED